MASWNDVFTAGYLFARVDRDTDLVTGYLENVERGGKVERNQDKDTYESGSITVSQGVPDLGSDLLRIFLAAEFADGSTETDVLATLVPNVPKTSYPEVSAEITLDGRLKELDEASFPPMTVVPAGTNVVEYAAGICRGIGLTVIAEASDYVLSTPWTLGSADGQGGTGSTCSKLADVNALLDLANFSAAYTDTMGRVIMERYVAPADRAVTRTYAPGEGRYLRDMTDTRDRTSVYNTVRCVYTTQETTIVGEARDTDPSSETSIPSIGYERVCEYQYDSETTQAAADAKAAELLRAQKIVRKVEFEHPWNGTGVRDAVQLATVNVSGKFAIRTQTIELGDGCMCTEELRAYV